MKRFCACLLCLLLAVGGWQASAAASPALRVLAVSVEYDTLTVTYWSEQPQADPLLTVLCRRDDDSTEILYAQEHDGLAKGLHTAVFTLKNVPMEGTALLRLGASASTPSPAVWFRLEQAGVQSAIPVDPGMTGLALKNWLGLEGDSARVVFNGETVDLTQPIPDGAMILLRPDNGEAVVCPLYAPGDVNADGQINAADALLVLQQSVKLTQLDAVRKRAANVDFNDAINAADALLILQYSVRLISGFLR